MTRDEFIKRFESPMNVEERIQLYVDSGMLKLDEPKSAFQKLCDAVHGSVWNGTITPAGIHGLLDAAGLKIVEK